MHKNNFLPLALLLTATASTAHAQGFAFTNSTLAVNNCKAASPAERQQAVAAANDAMARFPHGMVHVHTEGLLPGQAGHDESEQAMRDWPAARDLAVGYCVTGNPAYLEHADQILATWMKTYQPNFNPIDETGLENFFLAADILGDAMPAPLHAAWLSFAAKLSSGYLASIDKNAGKPDNWQSHRIKLAAMAAYTTADTGAIGHVESAFTTQLGSNIQSDGTTLDYGKRDAIHYVVYDLQPLVTAALAAHDHGENWYGIHAADGATLGMALDWLMPYANGTETHQEFNNSTVRFDATRRTAGVPGFSGVWSPGEAGTLYLFASALDRKYADLAYQLAGTPKLWQRLEMGMS
jgi:hypothetical protein